MKAQSWSLVVRLQHQGKRGRGWPNKEGWSSNHPWLIFNSLLRLTRMTEKSHQSLTLFRNLLHTPTRYLPQLEGCCLPVMVTPAHLHTEQALMTELQCSPKIPQTGKYKNTFSLATFLGCRAPKHSCVQSASTQAYICKYAVTYILTCNISALFILKHSCVHIICIITHFIMFVQFVHFVEDIHVHGNLNDEKSYFSLLS